MDIKLLILDVDGTLTDGKIYMSANGELLKAFNIKDGYALVHLPEYGVTPVIITGRQSEIVLRRCSELGIKEIYQGVKDKVECLKMVCANRNVQLQQCAYIGDDLNDLDCMGLCGHSAAPADAMKRVREFVDYVCEMRGGEGAVREYCDYIVEYLLNEK